MPKLPKFATEQEESEFWDTHDATDYLDETTPVDVTFVDARARKVLISMRVDRETIDKLKWIGALRGIGYQTLARMWLTERADREWGAIRADADKQVRAQTTSTLKDK